MKEQEMERLDEETIAAWSTYFARARDGRIIEFHAYPDTAGMMMELGMMSKPEM